MRQVIGNIRAGRVLARASGTSLAVLVFALITACASTPPPTEELQAAESAISQAEQARVQDYSAMELSEARQDLADAQAAVANENMVAAARLAELAKVNADLATAKAQAGRATAATQDVQKGMDVLKSEMQRNTKGEAQ